MTTDLQGNEYAKLSTLKEGDTIRLDGDFTCAIENSLHVLYRGSDGDLMFRCDEGDHNLIGQTDEDGDTLIGVYKQ